MKTWSLTVSLLLATTPALAIAQQSEPIAEISQAKVPTQAQSTMIQSQGAPVTVNWGQPSTLPNASDYQVKIADLDRNGDNSISRSEVPVTHALNAEFKLVDRNRDGRITAQELASWR